MSKVTLQILDKVTGKNYNTRIEKMGVINLNGISDISVDDITNIGFCDQDEQIELMDRCGQTAYLPTARYTVTLILE